MHRYQAQGLFFEVPNVSWRDGCFDVALPKPLAEEAAEVELRAELRLESRDAAFEFGTRDDGALAELYRGHVRYVFVLPVLLNGIDGFSLLVPFLRGLGPSRCLFCPGGRRHCTQTPAATPATRHTGLRWMRSRQRKGPSWGPLC